MVNSSLLTPSFAIHAVKSAEPSDSAKHKRGRATLEVLKSQKIYFHVAGIFGRSRRI
jgi:hypothetical protein